jgi:hypothetical protein
MVQVLEKRLCCIASYTFACTQAQDCSHWLDDRPCTGQCLIASAAQFHPQNRYCLLMPVTAPHTLLGGAHPAQPLTRGRQLPQHCWAPGPPPQVSLRATPRLSGSPAVQHRDSVRPASGLALPAGHSPCSAAAVANLLHCSQHTAARSSCCRCPQALDPGQFTHGRVQVCTTPSRSQTSPQGGCTARLVRY